MKFIDEYRDPALVAGLLTKIKNTARQISRPVTIMEICGSHTYAIGRFGIRKLLPENIRLISGPGCPVCVTSTRDVDIALYLSDLKNVIFATFGDMLRVPGTDGESLQKNALPALMSVLFLPLTNVSRLPNPIPGKKSS